MTLIPTRYKYPMKFHLWFALIMILGIAACGCTQPLAAPPATTTPASTSATVQPAPATGSSLATLSDTRPNTSFTPDTGFVIVSFKAFGPQKMLFNLGCGQDWGAFSEIRVTGPYSGSLPFAVPKNTECVFNISGSGVWTAQVCRPEMTTPLKVPVNLSGSGTTMTPYLTLEKGQYIFQREETGEGSPAYELRFANGSLLMNANNSFVQPGFGMFSQETFRIIDVPESGTYFLGVTARENPRPWNASIIAVPPIPFMGPGPVIP